MAVSGAKGVTISVFLTLQPSAKSFCPSSTILFIALLILMVLSDLQALSEPDQSEPKTYISFRLVLCVSTSLLSFSEFCILLVGVVKPGEINKKPTQISLVTIH